MRRRMPCQQAVFIGSDPAPEHRGFVDSQRLQTGLQPSLRSSLVVPMDFFAGIGDSTRRHHLPVEQRLQFVPKVAMVAHQHVRMQSPSTAFDVFAKRFENIPRSASYT
jgi:hypothetical protein